LPVCEQSQLNRILIFSANRSGPLPITFCSYPKGGTFTTKPDLKN
jgi:hypothetical protein